MAVRSSIHKVPKTSSPRMPAHLHLLTALNTETKMKSFLVLAVLASIYSPTLVQASAWPPADGTTITGTVTQSFRCTPSQPNAAPCWRYSLKASNGKIIPDLRIYQFGKILSQSGKPVYAHPSLKPDGTIGPEIAVNSPEGKKLAATFSSAASALKKGSRVRVAIMTCQAPHNPRDAIQCEADSLQLIE